MNNHSSWQRAVFGGEVVGHPCPTDTILVHISV